jgi:formylglycine-generating enzyme required for sulfatase activity
MSEFSRPSPTPPAKDAVVDGEYAAAPPSRSGDPMVAAFTGPQAAPRIDAVRRNLDLALDGWWRSGALPAPALLRDGLLLLEAGNPLDEAQRSLLLRAALTHRRGVLTALRYQTDPERTAVILAEAVAEGESPLRADELALLAQRDAQSADWQPPLLLALQQDAAHPDPARQSRIAAALAALDGAAGRAGQQPLATIAPGAEEVSEESAPVSPRPWLRFAPVLLLLGVIAGIFWWQQQSARDMVQIPAGVYVLARGVDDPPQTVELAAFAIDAFEVTNAAYRRCVEQNACAWPTATASATRDFYFLNPAFADYPVVFVDWANAARFCAFVGKRLPTAAEWEVGASYAPATARAYRYPWGDTFLVQAANSGALGLGDTTLVGAYRPTGDSPFGLSDMAGNVAEWTASPAEDGAGANAILVKGGSFRDDAGALQANARAVQPADVAAAWLGFRCASGATQP